MVTLQTDTVGNQLQQASDVKVRGVIVGEMRVGRGRRASGATIEMAINPDVPRPDPGQRHREAAAEDAVRRALRLAGASRRTRRRRRLRRRRRHRPGPVAERDRAEQVLNDLLPLLQAVQPQDLSDTLGAVADALRGRGDAARRQPGAARPATSGQLNTVAARPAGRHLRPGRRRRHLRRRAADDLLGVLDNLVGHQPHARRPGASSCVGPSPSGRAPRATTRRLPRDQRARTSSRWPQTSRPVLGAVRRVLARCTRACSTGWPASTPMISEAFGGRRRPRAAT